MRDTVGPCIHCLAGRGNPPDATRLPSKSPPATNPGQVISFDPQTLPHPALGGFTQKVTMFDEFTGLISQPGATSKSTSALFEPMSKVIKESFNAFGHHVPTLHGDAENVNHALRKPFGAIGTTIVNSLTGDHAHRAERSTRTVQDRVRAVVDGLPYVLPNELNLLADQAVGEALNHSTNKVSHPLTPAELTWGLKLTQQPAPFGRCAMVKQPDDKRMAISKSDDIPFKKVPVTEIGVSMGLKPRTNFTQWLLGNGRVVPRRPIGPLLPRWFIPFGWKPKPIIYNPLPMQRTIINDTHYETNTPIDTPLPMQSIPLNDVYPQTNTLVDNPYNLTDNLNPQTTTHSEINNHAIAQSSEATNRDQLPLTSTSELIQPITVQHQNLPPITSPAKLHIT